MDPSMFGLGLGGGLLQMLGNIFGAGTSGLFNQWSADKMMAFQQQMSSTSMQRGVQDMKMAGINPIMAFQHGASTPGGASASMPAPQMPDIIGGAVSSAMAKTRQDNEMELMAYDKLKRNQEINNLASTDAQIRAHTENVKSDTVNKLLRARIDAPEAARGDIDAAVYRNSAVSSARAAGTIAEEAARPVEALKNSLNPLKGMFTPSGRGVSRSMGTSGSTQSGGSPVTTWPNTVSGRAMQQRYGGTLTP